MSERSSGTAIYRAFCPACGEPNEEAIEKCKVGTTPMYLVKCECTHTFATERISHV